MKILTEIGCRFAPKEGWVALLLVGRDALGRLEDQRAQRGRVDLALPRLESRGPRPVGRLGLRQLRLERSPPLRPRVAAQGAEEERTEVRKPEVVLREVGRLGAGHR